MPKKKKKRKGKKKKGKGKKNNNEFDPNSAEGKKAKLIETVSSSSQRIQGYKYMKT